MSSLVAGLMALALAPVTLEMPAPLQAWAIAPDAQSVAWARDGNWFDVFDTNNGQRRWSGRGADGDQFTALAFAPTGETIAAAARFTPVIRTWETASGEPLLSSGASGGGAGELAYSPDGALLAVAGEDHSLHLLDARTGVTRGEIPLPMPRDGEAPLLAWANAQELVSVAELVILWELTGPVQQPRRIRELCRRPTRPGRVLFTLLDPMGRVALLGYEQGVQLIELASGKRRWEVAGPASGAAFTPSGDAVVLVNANGNRLVHRDSGVLIPLPVALQSPASSVRFVAGKVWLASDGMLRSAFWPYRVPPPAAMLDGNSTAAVPLLQQARREFGPVPYPPAHVARRVADLVRELHSDEFAIRERASYALSEMENSVTAELARYVAVVRDPEVQYRLNRICQQHDRLGGPVGVAARGWLERLERHGGPDAADIIRRVGWEGDPFHPITQAARRSLLLLTEPAKPR